MGHLTRIFNKYLPDRVLKTVDFYKAYPKAKTQKINKFLDEDAVKFLKGYKSFREGSVKFLSKDFKFSHAGSLIHSVEELFCDNIYAFHADSKAPYIIDCGANIGVSVVFFKQLYPEARILAFEPDKEIFRLLEENVRSFELADVTLENKAVWSKNEELTFYNEGALAGSLTTDFASKNNKVTIPAVDLLPYLNESVDFLKLDIEGAEHVVLHHIASKLSNVKHLFVEYHSDRNKPQQLNELLEIITNAGFRYYIKEADNITPNPYIRAPKGPYDLQLNISCYK